LEDNESPSTNLFAVWSTNIFYIGRIPYIIVKNELTLLTVIVPFKKITTFLERTVSAIKSLLMSIGISEPQVLSEVKEMKDIRFSKGTNRQTLGSMNDFMRLVSGQMEYHPEKSLEEINLYLNGGPCGPLKMGCSLYIAGQRFSKHFNT
jgi:hypothetical protein